MHESRRRSLAKAISWRLVAWAITTVVSYFVVGDVTVAVSLGIYDSLVKILAYYGHERAWLSIRFGAGEAAATASPTVSATVEDPRPSA